MNFARSHTASRARALTYWSLGVLLVTACSWFGGSSKPEWVDGPSTTYPASQYLVGIGQADSRPEATERAYGSVAKVFKAEVSTQAKDWESYFVIEGRGQTRTERRLTLDQVTQVSTDKILENVRVLDAWFDQDSRQYHVLAGLVRAQAEVSLMERMGELDRTIESDVAEARQAQEALAHARNLKRALNHLVVREALNADLRVVRASGHGIPAGHRVSDLTRELEEFLVTNLTIAVRISGDQAEPVANALLQGLVQEGFTVVAETDTEQARLDPRTPATLSITGTVRLLPIQSNDPRFTYVRWCSDAVLVDRSSQRILGAFSKGGKEGHVTEREAVARAVRVMQQEFASGIAKSIAAYIYRAEELSTTATPAAGCPGDSGRSTAQPSIRPSS